MTATATRPNPYHRRSEHPMTTRELERLSALLLKLHEEAVGDGQLRDEISHVRFYIDEQLDERER